MATCKAFIKALKPDAPATRGEVRRCFAHTDHLDWYQNLVDDLGHEKAYIMTVAMHVDAGIEFDEFTCLVIP